MNQIEFSKKGEPTGEVELISRYEAVSKEYLMDMISCGKIVIPSNNRNTLIKPCGIGTGLKTKVNANIGTSPDNDNLDLELKKLECAVYNGADTIMDLSIGKNISDVRREIRKRCPVPLGTVPVYSAFAENDNPKADEILASVEEHLKDGVDFVTVHCGVTRNAIPLVKKRVLGVVSRGGAMLLKWMKDNGKENPLFDNFDELLEIAKKYDATLSLGDGLRPGCIADATDTAQIYELKILGGLVKQCRKAGVQAMVEGPGHVPLNQIKKNVLLQKKICGGAPFYVLGPLVTDIAPGYDHITSAIGGAIAASHGVDYLCYVTPAEHLCLPTLSDVKEGVIASRIAAHAGDIVKGNGAVKDLEMARARKSRNWEKIMECAIDKEKAIKYRKESGIGDSDVCTMCGKHCSIRVLDNDR